MKSIDLDKLPKLPGVYIFKDENNNIIYIGKAISIRDRVKSYFQKVNQDWKIDMLLQEYASLEYITTSTEEEALILEASLIKSNKPKFNVLLKEGQPFLYFLITKSELPKLELVRVKKQKGIYFGPFLNKQKARIVYEFLLRNFKLKICGKKIANGCLDYHLGYCSGSCKNDFDIQDYKFRLDLVAHLLKFDTEKVKDILTSEIKAAASKLDFERAAHLHKYLESLEKTVAYINASMVPQKYETEVAYKSSIMPKHHIKPSEIGSLLQKLLKVEFEINTIDCFDISHFQGKWIVGSCIRFKDGIPEKSNFRRFKIRSLTDQNDYAALQEIVMRRYRDAANLPDVVLIDGGKGQLSAVKAVLHNAYCISLAKREETIFGPGFMNGRRLDLKSEEGLFLVALRDYAHHFAITYHRSKRSL